MIQQVTKGIRVSVETRYEGSFLKNSTPNPCFSLFNYNRKPKQGCSSTHQTALENNGKQQTHSNR